MNIGLFKVCLKHRTLSSRWGNLALAVGPVAFGLGAIAQAQPCDPDTMFGPGILYPAQINGAVNIRTADFNNDGVPDIVTEFHPSSTSGPGELNIMLGDGQGGFGPSSVIRVFPSGSRTFTLEVADLTGNGQVDILVGSFEGAAMALLEGRGDGTFEAPVVLPVPITRLGDLVLADMDNDGHLDAVLVDSTNAIVWIYRGDGAGNFTQAASVNTEGPALRLAVGDLDGDGNMDLVMTNLMDDKLRIIRSYGRLNFFAPRAIPLDPPFANRPTLADLNGDGILDIVMGHFFSGNVVSVLLGIDGLNYEPQATYPSGNTAQTVRVADMNGDGVPDLIVVNQGSEDVTLLIGRGDGTFEPERRFPVRTNPIDGEVMDLNGDGAPDFVTVCRGTLEIVPLLNTCVPGLAFAAPPQDIIADPGGRAVFTASVRGPLPIAFQWLFNGRPIDGANGPELVIESVRPGDEGLYALEISANGDTLRSPPARLAVFNACPGDFDGDGQLTIFDFLAFQNAFAAGCP